MEPSDIVLLILGILCPPGSVALKRGLNRDFIICAGLTLLFWLPGVAFSWYLVFKYPLENFRRAGGNSGGNNGGYHTIEEGLGRHSLQINSASDSGYLDDGNDEDSRSATMTLDSPAGQPLTTLQKPSNESLSASIRNSKRPHRKSSAASNSSVGNRKRSGSQSKRSSSGRMSRGSISSRSSNALQDAARSYALRHQQRQQSNAVKKWFVDRFYFADPTQVPPSTSTDSPDSTGQGSTTAASNRLGNNEQHELGRT